MVDDRLLGRPHAGMEDVHRSRRDERDLRPLVGVCRRRRRAWRFRLLAAAERFDDRLTDGFDPHASCRQHVGRDAALLAQQSEQQVFGAYVLLQQAVGFLGGVL
jgi:hypothetical protein